MPRTPEQINDADFALILAPGVGPITRRRLLEHFGDAANVLDATISALAEIRGIGRETAQALRRAFDEVDPKAERARMRDADAGIILDGDEDYPPLLAAISDPPPALWIRGQLADDDRCAVGIVGSRRCTAYGREQAGRFASLLAQSSMTIVSGGALGIDGEAHRGALRVGGRTIVVLGCGLSRFYPPEHEALFNRIAAEGGAVVSEYPMSTEPRAQHFPRRNRIISGLSIGILIIEAAKRSGALITARLAAEDHGREVMAVPGRIDSPASEGCNRLIQAGGAALVLDHADVLHQLEGSSTLLRAMRHHQFAARTAATNAPGMRAPGTQAPENETHERNTPGEIVGVGLTDAQRQILAALGESTGPVLLDQLAAETQLPMSRLMTEISLLQIRGRVQRDHRGAQLKTRR